MIYYLGVMAVHDKFEEVILLKVSRGWENGIYICQQGFSRVRKGGALQEEVHFVSYFIIRAVWTYSFVFGYFGWSMMPAFFYFEVMCANAETC